MIEGFLGDVLLAILQQPMARWSLALGVGFWVWMVADEEARLRKLYLAGPFVLAGLIEVFDSLFFGRNSGGGTGGWLLGLASSSALAFFLRPISPTRWAAGKAASSRSGCWATLC